MTEPAPGLLRGPQTICLSVIMRESDAAMVERCMVSVRPFLSHWVIVDSGSTEEVKETVRRVLAPLPGRIIDRAWTDDFAAARNAALDAARETGAEFMMTIDADDYFTFSGNGKPPPLPALSDHTAVRLVHGSHVLTRSCFARFSSGARWCGPVHEHLEAPHPTLLGGYSIVYSTRSSSTKRAYYRSIMLRELERRPDDLRTLYHLAVESSAMNDWQAARAYAERVLALCECGTDTAYSMLLLRAAAGAYLGLSTERTLYEYATTMAADPSRAEAPRSAASVCRARGFYRHAYYLDAIANTKTPPTGANDVDLAAYAPQAK